MVAEKPSIALALSQALSNGANVSKRKGVSPSAPVYEYAGNFLGMPARFKVTSTVGHMWSLDFPREYNNQNAVEPVELFDAPTQHMEDPFPKMSAHLACEATGAAVLVLWLDCDREGENICFEVIQTCQMHMRAGVELPGAYDGNIFRAHFSSLAPTDLVHAMGRLGVPDRNQSRSVDARQLIDLKLGVAFSRFQTRYFRTNFGAQLGQKKLSVTYGPCQTPTLWFCVRRADEIARFQPRPFWSVCAALALGGEGGAQLSVASAGGSVWEEDAAAAIVMESAAAAASGAVASADAEVSASVDPRPLPLNTLAMLRAASDLLGIGPGDAMHYASVRASNQRRRWCCRRVATASHAPECRYSPTDVVTGGEAVPRWPHVVPSDGNVGLRGSLRPAAPARLPVPRGVAAARGGDARRGGGRRRRLVA
jgi:DNA topoisomerase-3